MCSWCKRHMARLRARRGGMVVLARLSIMAEVYVAMHALCLRRVVHPKRCISRASHYVVLN